MYWEKEKSNSLIFFSFFPPERFQSNASPVPNPHHLLNCKGSYYLPHTSAWIYLLQRHHNFLSPLTQTDGGEEHLGLPQIAHHNSGPLFSLKYQERKQAFWEEGEASGCSWTSKNYTNCGWSVRHTWLFEITSDCEMLNPWITYLFYYWY